QRHSYPRRSIITIAAFIFSLCAGAAFAFIAEYFHFLSINKPEDYERWNRLGNEFINAFAGFVRLITFRSHK
ncbi:MAG: hypothetical protein ACUVUR_03140, partial [bacterium]